MHVLQDTVKGFDVVGLTETLNNNFDKSLFDDFEVFTGDSNDKLCGTHGLAFLIRKGIKHHFSDHGIGMSVKIIAGNEQFTIGLFYLPCENSKYWDASLFDKLQNNVISLKLSSAKTIMMGDFNARTGEMNDFVDFDDNEDMLPVRKNKDKKVNTNGRLLTELCKTCDMRIVNGLSGFDSSIGEFTCQTYNGESTVDYVLVDTETFRAVEGFKILDQDKSISDVHRPIVFKLTIKAQLNRTENRPNFKEHRVRRWNETAEAKYRVFFQTQTIHDLKSMLDEDLVDINKVSDKMETFLIHTAEKAGAIITTTPKAPTNTYPWFDRECMNERRMYRKIRRSSVNDSLKHGAYNKYRNFLRIKKLTYTENLNSRLLKVKSTNPQEYWSIVKRLNGIKPGISTDLYVLYEHFQQLGLPSEDQIVVDIDHIDMNDDTSDLSELNRNFTTEEISKCVRKMNNGKSARKNMIFAELIKSSSEVFIEFITNFFYCILNTGETPDSWDISIIHPIHKKGNSDDPNNYRGISLFDIVSKLFTAAVTARLNAYLNKNDLLEEQAGFRSGHSCMDHVYLLTSIIDLTLTEGRRLYATFIDYEKAIDRVNRFILWSKVYNLGIKGKVLRAMKNLYSKTKAQVRVNDELSNIFPCKLGVRQGDTLSPILFAIFLNDFEKYVSDRTKGFRVGTGIQRSKDNKDLNVFLKLFVLLYADDTILLNENEEDMQKAINDTADYCTANDLKINVSKTKFMIFSRGKVKNVKILYMDDTPIERVDTFTYLGVKLKYNNTFQTAIKHNVEKAKKALFKLEMTWLKVDVSIPTKIHLFDHTIMPILLYGCEIWGYDDIEQIEVFHRNYLRQLLKLRKGVPNPMIYGELGRREIVFTIWKRMLTFWKTISKPSQKLSKVFLDLTKNNEKLKWPRKIKSILVELGIHGAFEHINFMEDTYFRTFIKIKCDDLAIQSWRTKTSENSLCKIYSWYKSELKMERYITILKPNKRNKLAQFRCAPYWLQTVQDRFSGTSDHHCKLCKKSCIPDEYHLLLKCPSFDKFRNKELGRLGSIPSMYSLHFLMNATSSTKLSKLANFCEHIGSTLINEDETVCAINL